MYFSGFYSAGVRVAEKGKSRLVSLLQRTSLRGREDDSGREIFP